MSLPQIPGDRYVLNVRTHPEGNLQVQFSWHDDACRLLLDQAALYAGNVTAFHATIAEHTAKDGRRVVHEVHWRADGDTRGLQAFVVDTLRSDLARRLMDDLDLALLVGGTAVSKVMHAEWGWNATDDGYFLDDLPLEVRLADGTVVDDLDDLMDSSLYQVADRLFAESVFGIRDGQHLVIRRSTDGAISATAEPDPGAAPTFKATA